MKIKYRIFWQYNPHYPEPKEDEDEVKVTEKRVFVYCYSTWYKISIYP